MKIYNTKTQSDYDSLMSYLEEQGCKWFYGEKPTGINLWFMYKETTCLRVDNYSIIHSSLDYYKEKYPNENIIEYKARVENMKQEEMKYDLQKIAFYFP